MIKGVVIGILLTMLVGVGGVYYYFAAGMAPAATADPPMPFEKKLAHMALNAHIEKQQAGQAPVAADETRLPRRRRGLQEAMRLVSRTARPVPHRLCDNHVSQSAAVVPRTRCD